MKQVSIDLSAQSITTHADPASLFDEEDLLAGEALATVIHEIKTPLTSLLGYARMLRINGSRMDEPRREECFHVIERQGRRVVRMLEDLLASSRLSNGGALRRAPLNLAAAIDAAVKTANGLTNEHRFVVDAPSHDLGLYGDRSAVEHIVTNLLENAIKYSPAGTLVTVTVREAAGEVHVHVADEGPGISEDELPHVFERYHRAGVSSVGGAGLGLSIVAGLVAAHGGRVWVSSEPGIGTTFSFSLPRRADR